MPLLVAIMRMGAMSPSRARLRKEKHSMSSMCTSSMKSTCTHVHTCVKSIQDATTRMEGKERHPPHSAHPSHPTPPHPTPPHHPLPTHPIPPHPPTHAHTHSRYNLGLSLLPPLRNLCVDLLPDLPLYLTSVTCTQQNTDTQEDHSLSRHQQPKRGITYEFGQTLALSILFVVS